MKKVLDVSKWNVVTDWEKVAKDVDAVIIRAAYRKAATGELTTDTKFKEYIEGASNAGIPLSVYFFTQAINETEAIEEANYVLNLIKGYSISLPIFIDSEAASNKNGRADGLDIETRTSILLAFVNRINQKGYIGGIYASDYWFKHNLQLDKLSDCKLWVAKYSTTSPVNVKNYEGWQYTSKGSVNGANGNVDLSNWYGEIAKIDPIKNKIEDAKEAIEIFKGKELKLSGCRIFANAKTAKVAGTKTGTFYVWNATPVEGRIRITNSKLNVGKAGRVTGWINISDIEEKIKDIISEKEEPKKKIKAGDKVTLNKVNFYSSSKSVNPASVKSGTYYIWSDSIMNERIRVTTNSKFVGKNGYVTGWIDVSSIS